MMLVALELPIEKVYVSVYNEWGEKIKFSSFKMSTYLISISFSFEFAVQVFMFQKPASNLSTN